MTARIKRTRQDRPANRGGVFLATADSRPVFRVLRNRGDKREHGLIAVKLMDKVSNTSTAIRHSGPEWGIRRSDSTSGSGSIGGESQAGRRHWAVCLMV